MDAVVTGAPMPCGDEPAHNIAQLGGGHRGGVVGRAEPDRVQHRGPPVLINVRAPFVAAKAAAAHMHNSGRIIDLGSNAAQRMVFRRFTLYALSKSALIGLTKGLGRELRQACVGGGAVVRSGAWVTWTVRMGRCWRSARLVGSVGFTTCIGSGAGSSCRWRRRVLCELVSEDVLWPAAIRGAAGAGRRAPTRRFAVTVDADVVARGSFGHLGTLRWRLLVRRWVDVEPLP
jgi:hypothetical protein